MSDANSQDKHARIGLARPSAPRIEVKKPVESGVMKQSFSHGRSKAVAVEVKRAPVVVARPTLKPSTPAPQARAPNPGGPSHGGPGHGGPSHGGDQQRGQPLRRPMLKPLTDDERSARMRAVTEARRVEDDARKRAEENSRRATEENARRKAEDDAAAKRKTDEENRKRAEEEARRKAEEQAARMLADEQRRAKESETRAAAPPRVDIARADASRAEADPKPDQAKRANETLVTKRPKLEVEGDDDGKGKAKVKIEKRPTLKPSTKDEKRPVRVAADGEVEERVRSMAAYRRHMQRGRQQQVAPSEPVTREVVLPETITVAELAARMAVRSAEVVKILMKNGIMATINHVIDADTAEIVVGEFGHKVKRVSESDVEEGIEGIADVTGVLLPRAPIVTVMGHVDHGKTSLLDALRSTKVAAGEAGGITQHIGAYQVDVGSGTPVTFIDTPGHAAFTAMRARGASVTDVVVLVVAADDGVMPQTIEAIRHAKAANVPIVVAINKMDKPDASPERVKTDLLSHEVVAEEFGGEVMVVPVSALKRTGLDKLIETLQLQAEILDLKGNPDREAHGAIIEARLDRGRGVVATVLVQNGTLKVGDLVVAGAQWGRVRALLDDHGNTIDKAGPSMPVEILGLDGVPDAGDRLAVVETEKKARDIAEYRQRKKRDQAQVIAGGAKTSLEDMFSQLKNGDTKELPIVIKCDVQGSLEAISAGLGKLRNDEVSVRVLHGGVGAITESDVTLAVASKAAILGFNVRANAQAREMARRDGIEIRYYSIIYELLDQIKGLLSGMLKPERRETILGHAEIRQVFDVSKVGKIAGCRVVDGLIRRTARARLLRDNVVIYDGALGSLKRFKDDAREVKDGFECGMSIENYNDIREGDVIEAYEVEEVARTI